MTLKFIKSLRLIGLLLIFVTVLPSSAHAEWIDNRHPLVANQQIQSTALADGNEVEIRADSLSTDKIAGMYEKPSVFLQQNDSVRVKALIAEDGFYTLAFDMAAGDTLLNQPEGQLMVDGDFPANDARGIVFPIYFKNSVETFPLDRYGNEALSRQEICFAN
jgi:hypothetical protein